VVKWLIPTLACAAGVSVFAVGLLYGVFTVGVPTPDAPPSVAAREARDVALAGAGMAAGLFLLASGLVGLVLVAIAYLARRRWHDV
jgi:hypothetical protein